MSRSLESHRKYTLYTSSQQKLNLLSMSDTVPQGNMRNVQLELSVKNDDEQSLWVGKSCKENVLVTLSIKVFRNEIFFWELKDSLGHFLLLFVKIMTICVNLFSLLDWSQILGQTLNLSLRNDSVPKAYISTETCTKAV